MKQYNSLQLSQELGRIIFISYSDMLLIYMICDEENNAVNIQHKDWDSLYL